LWLTHFDDRLLQTALFPAVRKFCDWSIHPNVITVLALAMSAAIPFLHFARLSWWVVASMVLRQFLDCLDGEVARRCHKISKWGGLFSGLAFGGWLALHIIKCKGSGWIDHSIKDYGKESLYLRTYAYLVNNSLIVVVVLAILYMMPIL
jgi:hypothetical protein